MTIVVGNTLFIHIAIAYVKQTYHLSIFYDLVFYVKLWRLESMTTHERNRPQARRVVIKIKCELNKKRITVFPAIE